MVRGVTKKGPWGIWGMMKLFMCCLHDFICLSQLVEVHTEKGEVLLYVN